MSEPMSSGEIEDVLSSIRRLVSEDLRPAPKLDTAMPHAAATARPASGKLLLTPALRVVATQDEGAPVTPGGTSQMWPGGDPVVEAPYEFAQDDEGPGADVKPLHRAATSRLAQDEDMILPDQSPVAHEDWVPEATMDPRADGPETEADAAGLERASTARNTSSDMPRVVSDIAAGVSDAEDDWELETGDAAVADAPWPVPEWVEEAELVDEENAGATETLNAADLAEAAAVAEIMARAAQAEAEAEARAAMQPEVGANDLASGTDYYDEAVLRDLVRDLIREELGGPLGERITRNIRKLVRSEINRASTLRDFE